ncbi:MAG TPA: hypothetical protein VKB51_09255 [bacterium]|nr:hypothetical protein [bacterium]
MPADAKQTTADDNSLREIESLVRAVPLEEPPAPAAAQAEPDLESVARDLGISVEEVKALREASLG